MMAVELCSYDTKPLFDRFPAFHLFHETVLDCVSTAITCQLEGGADPREVFAFVQTEAGMIVLADLVFDGFAMGGRQSG